jgi:hypothetical protein
VSENSGTLDDLYLEWLYKNYVGAVSNRNPNSTFWKLTHQLYTTRFTWIIRDDKNRAEDGKDLQNLFYEQCDIQDTEIDWQWREASVLEVLIGLACRASFDAGGEPGDWLWKFLDNLDLRSYNDRVYSQIVAEEVDANVRKWLDREYDKNGVGGIFPLKHARQDQTQVNLWYQLQDYIFENSTLSDAS